jgi:hypothetical protein
MAIKTVTTPKDRAKMAGINNKNKAYARADKRDKASDEKWDGRGTSGAEIKAKEYEKPPARLLMSLRAYCGAKRMTKPMLKDTAEMRIRAVGLVKARRRTLKTKAR